MRRTKRGVLESIAANVARSRRGSGFTQEALAESAGVDVRTIQDLEGARYNTTVLTLMAVAESLDVALDALVKPATLPPRKRGRPKVKRKA